MSVSISIGMSLWRLCGCERVSVLRHLAAAAAVQLNNSLPINYTALYESRIPGHFVEVCSRPRHNLKTFLQILFFFPPYVVTHTGFSFRRPRIKLKVPFVVFPCMLKLMTFDSYQWIMITLTPPLHQRSSSILSIIPFELFVFFFFNFVQTFIAGLKLIR